MDKKLHGNNVIWRYTTLDKFLYLLNNEKLYFSNVGEMTDKYEGKLPHNNRKSYLSKLIRDGLSEDEAEIELMREENEYNKFMQLTFVNCWTVNPSESYALWKIYLEGSKSGIAIKTTVSRLKKSLSESNYDIVIKKVKYLDYISDYKFDRTQLFTTKRTYYSYEEELRLLSLHYHMGQGKVEPALNNKYGYGIDVNLNELIQNIFVSPFVGTWIYDTIRKTIALKNPNLVDKMISSDIRDF